MRNIFQHRMTRRRKFAFWLMVGMFSVVCVEVPAGSTMFPFFTPWGLLVVWPLYLLHIVFLAAVVFRFGRPGFWPLYCAGMLFGLYEAYITKVVWVSFRPEGPFFTAGGIALFETIILVLFLHPLLAFVVPLLLAEVVLTNSAEVLNGLPQWLQGSIRNRPMVWACCLMAMFGLMQFVNSPSTLSSVLSGLGNGLVLGLAIHWWRRSGGANYSLGELLPGQKGLKVFALLLLAWYAFWGCAIKPKAIPAVVWGQLTVWCIYLVLSVLFYLSLKRSRSSTAPEIAGAPNLFTWRRFLVCVAVATVVTGLARLFVYPFAATQVVVFFCLYTVTGLALFLGAAVYGLRNSPNQLQPLVGTRSEAGKT